MEHIPWFLAMALNPDMMRERSFWENMGKCKCECMWLIVHFIASFNLNGLYNYTLGRPI